MARVAALDNCFVGELITLTLVKALSLNIEFFISGLTVLGNDRQVEQADIAERSFTELLIQVGFFLIGRVIDPASNFLDTISIEIIK